MVAVKRVTLGLLIAVFLVIASYAGLVAYAWLVQPRALLPEPSAG